MDLAGGRLDPPRVRGETRVRGADLAAGRCWIEEGTGLEINARIQLEKGREISVKERLKQMAGD